jgi:hypothetical protein
VDLLLPVVIIDINSRYVPGWMLAAENARLAQAVLGLAAGERVVAAPTRRCCVALDPLHAEPRLRLNSNRQGQLVEVAPGHGRDRSAVQRPVEEKCM